MRYEIRARVAPGRVLLARPWVAIVALALIGTFGCSAPPSVQPVSAVAKQPDFPSQAEFWRALRLQPIATNDDAAHALLLFLNGSDEGADYNQRLDQLKKEGLLAADYQLPARQAMDRGTIATILVRGLRIPRGITMSVLGVNDRYAVRELVFRDLYPASSPAQLFTGDELIGVLAKAEDYRRGNAADYPARVLFPPQKDRVASVPPTAPQEVDANLPTFALNPELSSEGAVIPQFLLIEAPATEPGSAMNSLREASTPAGPPPRFKVSGVKGLAFFSADGNPPWNPIATGLELTGEIVIETGPDSAVQLALPGEQTLSVDALSIAEVDLNGTEAGRVKTRSLLEGRERIDLEKPAPGAETVVHAGTSTLAIRGTRVSVRDQPPFPAEGISLTGRAEFRVGAGLRVRFGSRGGGRVAVRTDTPSAAQLALLQTIIDPNLNGARTDSEQKLLANLIASGAIVRLDPLTGIPDVFGGEHPSGTSTAGLAKLATILPPGLDFVLRWSVPKVDLNLGVSTPTDLTQTGVLLYPARGTISGLGGHVLFDDKGGPFGGIEVIDFPGKPPRGIYTMTVTLVSGGSSSAATLNVFQGGASQYFTTEVNRPIITDRIPSYDLGMNNTPFAFYNVQSSLAPSRVAVGSQKTDALGARGRARP